MNGKNFNHSKIMVVFAVREGRFFCLYLEKNTTKFKIKKEI